VPSSLSDLHQEVTEQVLSQFNESQLLIARQAARQIESYLDARSQDVRYLSSLTSLRRLDVKTMPADVQAMFTRLKVAYVNNIVVLEAVLHRPEFTEALPALQKSGLVTTSGDKLDNVRLFRGSGCTRCGGTGYRGRIAICELFEVDTEIRQMISKHSNAALFRTTAIRQGMRTMFQDGLEKALLGETTIDELIRTTA